MTADTLPGVFPDCGCHYTTADDGVHFCRMHAAAPDLLAACEACIEQLSPSVVNVVVRPGVVPYAIKLALAAVAKATGR